MIQCINLSKSYKVGHSHRQVLRNVNFRMGKGEKVGFLGRNGAGKTTLIKLIGGVELPTSGRVERKMSVSWPLGFGGGFQGSLTGYDNARFIARIYGKNFREMFDFIEDFTELGKQLKMPAKTYSSGMRARLAMGLSLAIEFDCYLIDEVLMVGDQDFQRKCHHELFEKRSDRALILASHSPALIRDYCSEALIVSEGQVRGFSDIDEALQIYEAL